MKNVADLFFSLLLLSSPLPLHLSPTKQKKSYEEIPDPESDVSLPLVTITDFASGGGSSSSSSPGGDKTSGKEVILLIAGEVGREALGPEVALWLTSLLSGVSPPRGRDPVPR